MTDRVLVIGLDCLGPELLAPVSLAELPHLRAATEAGTSGPLASTLPPITVPAWTSMMTGRDPGELGIYGFRNRPRFDYSELTYASSRQVRFPRVWDLVGRAGRRSIVVGVPQTWPAPQIVGELVAGFEAEGSANHHTFPRDLASEIATIVGPYRFDVADFRSRSRAAVLAEIVAMTRTRFEFMAHLLRTRAWDFAMVCEIGPDRLHHCFWSDHDPAHPRHDPASPYARTVRDYYRLLDDWVGELVATAGPDCLTAIVSDHGAQAMQGGVCINEILRRLGWLVLLHEPESAVPLAAPGVDWTRTRAWATGGYYARIFLNIAGREPSGVIPASQRDSARERLAATLSTLSLPEGPTLDNQVMWPERTYRHARGFPPDLMVFFGESAWRSLGTVGHRKIWQVGNDIGVDQANHARDGMYVLCGRGASHCRGARASILDIAPTLLTSLGVAVPAGLQGRNLLGAGMQ